MESLYMVDFDVTGSLATPSESSSPESNTQPHTPISNFKIPLDSLKQLNDINIIDTPHKSMDSNEPELTLNWNEEMLNQEIEQVMAETEPLHENEWNCDAPKRKAEHMEGTAKDDAKLLDVEGEQKTVIKEKRINKQITPAYKKQKVDEDQLTNGELLKSFHILRDNYLNLCSGYNQLLEKYNELESDKCKLILEREHTKSIMSSLNHEVVNWRRKERERGFGKPKPSAPVGSSTISDRLL